MTKHKGHPRKGTGAVNRTYKHGGLKAVWKRYLGHVKGARAALRWAKRKTKLKPHPFRKVARIYGHRLHHLIVHHRKHHGHRGRGRVLKMQDSVEAGALDPSAADVFLFYADGPYANGTAVKAQTPGKIHLGITVNASTPCGGEVLACDNEPGDLTAATAAAWSAAGLGHHEEPDPYCSVSAVAALDAELKARGVAKGVNDPRIHVVTAHYTNVPHLCDARCWRGLPSGFKASGTQYHGSMLASDPDLSLIERSALP